MREHPLTDQELELMIRDALLEDAERRWGAELDALDAGEPHPVSEAHRKWEEEFLKDPFGYTKRAARPRWKRTARVCLAAVIAALTLGGAMAASSAVRTWLMDWGEQSVGFTFSRSQEELERQTQINLGDYCIFDLPWGYEETRREEGNYGTTVIYENWFGKQIEFFHGNLFEVIPRDTQGLEIRALTVNGLEAQLHLPDGEGEAPTLYVYNTPVDGYSITADQDEQTLIAMAESVGERQIEPWTIGQMPDGYEETDRTNRIFTGHVTYYNAEGKRIVFSYGAMVDGVATFLDNEHRVFTDLTIHGQPAQLAETTLEDDENYIVIFNEDLGRYFVIFSSEDADTLIAMAESLRTGS